MPIARKRLQYFLAGSAGLGAAALGGALIHYTRPSVQRELLLERLHGAGWTGDIASVSLRLDGELSLDGLKLTDPSGRRYEASHVEGALSPWETLLGTPHVERLEAEGLVLDLSEAVSGTGAGGAFSIPAVRADSVNARGAVKLAGGRRVAFDLRAREVDTRKGATLVFRLADAAGPTLTGELRAKISGSTENLPEDPFALWATLRPSVVVQAEARPSAGSPAAATIDITADAATATLAVRAGKGRADLRANLAVDGSWKLAGDLAVDRTSLAPWLGDATPPAFATRGKVSANWHPVTRATGATVAFSGELDAPRVGAAGLRAFAVEAAFSGVPGGAWSIRKIHAEAGSSAAPRAILVDAAGVTVHPGERWRVETAEGRAASVRLDRAPLAWLNPFLSDRGVSLSGGEVSGEVRLARDASGRVTLDSGSGLASTAFSAMRDGRVWLDKLEFLLPLRAERAPDGALSASVSGARLTRAGESVVSADLEWARDAAGAARLSASAFASPGALPTGLLPGGACDYCRETGLRFAGGVRVGFPISGPAVIESGRLEGVMRDGRRAFGASLLRPLAPGAPYRDGGALVALEFKGAPLSLLNPLLGGPSLDGVAESGDLHLSLSDSGWKLARPAEGAPAFVRGLSWTNARGRTVLAPTDARGSLQWEQSGEGRWRLGLDDITFENSTGRALGGRLDFAWDGDAPGAFSANLTGDLGAFAAAVPALGRARIASGEYSVRLGHDPETADEGLADVEFRGVRAAPEAPALGLQASARLSRDESGLTRMRAPLALSGPSGVTRLELSASVRKRGGVREWDAALKGDTLHADDWVALFSGYSAPAAPGAGGARTGRDIPDTKPFWSGDAGRFSASLEAVRVAGESVAKPSVSLVVTPERITATGFGAQLRGLPVSGEGALGFTAGSERPYVLTAKAAGRDMPVGRIVEAVSPNASGWVDGDFDLDFGAAANGGTPSALADNLVLTLEARSSEGTLRFFRADNEAVRLSGELAEVAGDLAGDLGRILGKRAPGVGRLLDGASVIQKALNLVKYKRFALSLKRMPDGSIELPSAEVMGETLRLSGSGRIGPAQGPEFRDRHATVNARLDGRNVIADALRAIGRTEGAADNEGWVAGPEMRYDGPLNNLRNNLLNNLFRAVSAPTPGDRPKSIPGAALKVTAGAAAGAAGAVGAVLDAVAKPVVGGGSSADAPPAR